MAPADLPPQVGRRFAGPVTHIHLRGSPPETQYWELGNVVGPAFFGFDKHLHRG
jgi:hypothetical protein